jgi:peptidoglycan/xylan/chitin deacetylase (PgdA/CDA1 family)
MFRDEALTARRRPRTFCPNIIAFHKLSPRLSFGSTNYSPRRFWKLINRLTAAGYVSSDLTDVLQNYDGRKIAVTFDDGYRHLQSYLPAMMEDFGFRPTVFVPSRYIGKVNSWDYSCRLRPEAHLSAQDIRDLAGLGVEFGSHGCRHLDLTGLGDRELELELRESKAALGDILGREVTAVSYPFGKYDERVTQAAAAGGYRYGFTMSFPDPNDSPLALGRYAVYGYDSQLAVLLKLNRGFLYGLEKAKAKLTNRLADGTIILNKLRRPESS